MGFFGKSIRRSLKKRAGTEASVSPVPSCESAKWDESGFEVKQSLDESTSQLKPDKRGGAGALSKSFSTAKSIPRKPKKLPKKCNSNSCDGINEVRIITRRVDDDSPMIEPGSSNIPTYVCQTETSSEWPSRSDLQSKASHDKSMSTIDRKDLARAVLKSLLSDDDEDDGKDTTEIQIDKYHVQTPCQEKKHFDQQEEHPAELDTISTLGVDSTFDSVSDWKAAEEVHQERERIKLAVSRSRSNDDSFSEYRDEDYYHYPSPYDRVLMNLERFFAGLIGASHCAAPVAPGVDPSKTPRSTERNTLWSRSDLHSRDLSVGTSFASQ
jgi:hypothetical protein